VSSQFARTTRSLAKDTSLAALFAWAVCGILLLAWFGWFFFSTVTLYEVSRSARLEVQQSAHPIAVAVPGKLISASLEIGQEVKAGDLLFQLDASSEQLRLREEESRLTAMAPRQESMQREIEALEKSREQDQQALQASVESARFRAKEASLAFEFARDNERRLKEESVVGGVSQVEALRAAAEARKLAANRDSLASDVKRLESDAQSRGQSQQAQVENLKRSLVSLQGEQVTTTATIARLQQDIDKLSIRAPVAGIVAEVISLRAGSYVSQGQKIATIVPRGGLLVVADFTPSAVLGRMHPGQHGRMRLDGFPWTEFGSLDAHVVRVSTEIRDQLVRVELALEANSGSRISLQHGLPGSIEVAIEQTSPAVLVMRAIGQMSSQSKQQAAAPAMPKS
jgi:membrane fusion protein (multidrug efflux system)